MLDLGMSLPGLPGRGAAIAQLPALGLLTLAGLNPPSWTCSYHESGELSAEALAEQMIELRPELVAVSALTASIEEAYRFSGLVRRAGLRVVIGGLHATSCSEEAGLHADSVVVGEGERVWASISTTHSADLSSRFTAPVGRSIWPTRRSLDSICSVRRRDPASPCKHSGAARLPASFRGQPAARADARKTDQQRRGRATCNHDDRSAPRCRTRRRQHVRGPPCCWSIT